MVRNGYTTRTLFKKNEISESVKLYRNNKGEVVFTGMDAAGASSFKDKAAYFGFRIKSGNVVPGSVVSFPLDLLEQELRSLGFGRDLKDEIKILG